GAVGVEAHAEGAALAAVEGENGLVLRDAGEGAVDHRARHALALRLARDRAEKDAEVAAALRCAGGRRREGRGGNEDEQAGERARDHAVKSLVPLPGTMMAW